jgi:predicted  nucleic acid-binding Zn-ribbon protein
MADEPDDLTHRMLRDIDRQLNRLTEHVADLSTRLAGLEAGMGALTERMDRAETRLDRIESQLGLGVTTSSLSDWVIMIRFLPVVIALP